jgi:hypothetical protein
VIVTGRLNVTVLAEARIVTWTGCQSGMLKGSAGPIRTCSLPSGFIVQSPTLRVLAKPIFVPSGAHSSDPTKSGLSAVSGVSSVPSESMRKTCRFPVA